MVIYWCIFLYKVCKLNCAMCLLLYLKIKINDILKLSYLILGGGKS